MNNTPIRHIVIGMAGHIDHGKTSLVEALTGTNTDRLKEEIERGMTTDLGFAFFTNDIMIIDVPGHEKFVKTMVAGVNTVDFAILVIAADDGVMPQTKEHLEILNLLKVSSGIVALTKIDLVEPDWLELVKIDISNLIKGTVLEEAPIIPVDSVSRKGIDTLKTEILKLASNVQERFDKGVFRMPIDRVFTIKGFGTVVAGTILSGKVKVDDYLELMPHNLKVRVRGIQVHEKSVSESFTGCRTAINLMNVEKETIERGDVVVQPGYFKPTSMIDTHYTHLSDADNMLKNRDRVRVHIGTTEAMARIIILDKEEMQPGDEGFIQIHFEKPVVADFGDRYVLRNYSPVKTIGGGKVLDVQPKKHKRLDVAVIGSLSSLLKDDPKKVVLEQLVRIKYKLISSMDLSKSIGIPADKCFEILKQLETLNYVLFFDNNLCYAVSNLKYYSEKTINIIEEYFKKNTLKVFIQSGEVLSRLKEPVEKKLFDQICNSLKSQDRIELKEGNISIPSRQIVLSEKQIPVKNEIEKAYLESLLSPPGYSEILPLNNKTAEEVFSYMIESGILIKGEDEIYFHKSAIDEAKKKLAALFTKQPEMTVSDIRQNLGMTRKYVMPLLAHLDNTGFTIRVGDVRKLKNLS